MDSCPEKTNNLKPLVYNDKKLLVQKKKKNTKSYEEDAGFRPSFDVHLALESTKWRNERFTVHLANATPGLLERALF